MISHSRRDSCCTDSTDIYCGSLARRCYSIWLPRAIRKRASLRQFIHLDTNILGALRLLEALRGCQDINPVIHVCSSSEVFGRVLREKLPINEDCPFETFEFLTKPSKSSFLRKQESSSFKVLWIPAFARMTKRLDFQRSREELCKTPT